MISERHWAFQTVELMFLDEHERAASATAGAQKPTNSIRCCRQLGQPLLQQTVEIRCGTPTTMKTPKHKHAPRTRRETFTPTSARRRLQHWNPRRKITATQTHYNPRPLYNRMRPPCPALKESMQPRPRSLYTTCLCKPGTGRTQADSPRNCSRYGCGSPSGTAVHSTPAALSGLLLLHPWPGLQDPELHAGNGPLNCLQGL